MELINILSEYSVDCIAVAALSSTAVCLIKKRLTLPDKVNRLTPFFAAFFIYALLAAFGLYPFETVHAKCMTAGGLATVIYAFFGGFSRSKEEELKNLMATLLRTVVTEERIAAVTEQILSGISKTDDDRLITVKVSDLIRRNLAGDTDEQKIQLVTAVFVRAYRELLATKKKRKGGSQA